MAPLNYPKGMFQGKTVIVTGSGQGIGAEAARLFANEGANVVVTDLNAEKTKEVVEKINSSGGRAVGVSGDITDDAFIAKLVKEAAQFGNGKIHIIVNNAGVTWDGVIHKMTDAQWDFIMKLHCAAPFKLVRAAAPYFRVKDGEHRTIINISSASGLHGNAGQANYAVAKAGIVGLSKTIAKEWGPNFGVCSNTIAFGHILTRLTAAKEKGEVMELPTGEKIPIGIPGMKESDLSPEEEFMIFGETPLRRAGTPTEAAGAIVAVASPYMSYLTGQTISVTGGKNC